jgi:hypothetical protein
MKEIERHSHHRCSKCGHEWFERLMIFENGEVKVLQKEDKEYKKKIIRMRQVDCYNANEDMGL